MKKNKNLVSALNDSLNNSSLELMKNICDSSLVDLADASLFGGIPFCNFLVTTFKLGKGILTTFYLKKIARFITSFEDGLISEHKLEKYKFSLKNDSDKLSKELEYITVILDRYLNDFKADYLAKLYLAYLDKYIDWDTFVSYSSSLDRLLYMDIEILRNGRYFGLNEHSDCFDSVCRLESVGFIYKETPRNVLNESFEVVADPLHSRGYTKTIFGSRFLYCIFKTH